MNSLSARQAAARREERAVNLKLKACDICAAVTSKEDEEFHAQWHAANERRLRSLECAMSDHLDGHLFKELAQ